MLRFDEVTFAHPDREPVLEGFSMTVDEGEAVRLAGESGAGKSTALRLATGAIPRVHGGRLAGRVTLAGVEVERLSAPALASRIGYVPQDPETAFVARTVRRELEGVLGNVGVDPDQVEPRLRGALSCFDALELAGREVTTLSGGEAARAALAAAVAADPDVLVLDEPHAQLDAASRERLAETLRGLRAGGRSILLAAHDPHPFEAAVDRTRRLEGSRADRSRVELPAPPGGDALLVLEDVVHAYEDGPRIGPVDLTLRAGEVVALRGPNGSGKTTAMHAAAGLVEPTDGRVRVLGEAPSALDAGERARRLGVAFQHPAWHITQDTLEEEVALTARNLGAPVDARAWLKRVGLACYADAHPWDLSGGQRQRMAVATALAHEPDVALLDEPTRGLDAVNRDRLAALLAERTRRGQATLVASHHPWIAQMAHRTVELGEASEREAVEEVVYA